MVDRFGSSWRACGDKSATSGLIHTVYSGLYRTQACQGADCDMVYYFVGVAAVDPLFHPCVRPPLVTDLAVFNVRYGLC
jgi:hypothetical protein